VSFEQAKTELYPPTNETSRPVRLHPAEKLTKTQLAKIGMSLRNTKKSAPKGVDPITWAKRRRAELDWIWSEWTAYQKIERERDAFWSAFAAAEQNEGGVQAASGL
jgi:hypothetical protein